MNPWIYKMELERCDAIEQHRGELTLGNANLDADPASR
jgi:hypothetical protein